MPGDGLCHRKMFQFSALVLDMGKRDPFLVMSRRFHFPSPRFVETREYLLWVNPSMFAWTARTSTSKVFSIENRIHAQDDAGFSTRAVEFRNGTVAEQGLFR